MNIQITQIIKEKINKSFKGDNKFVSDIIDQILGNILQIGYDNFLEGLADGIFNPNISPDLIDSGELVNVIPSKGSGSKKCSPVLIAFSKGKLGELGFNGIQNKIRSHLARCRDKTNLVVCFADFWDASAFQDEHYEGLLSLKKKDKVEFVFILIGNPDNVFTIAPVNI